MTGWWLVGYIAMGVVDILVLGLLVGTLPILGEVRTAVAQLRPLLPPGSEDGPEVGSQYPNLATDSLRGHDTTSAGYPVPGRRLLLAFLTPTCGGCQRAADSLNNLAATRAGDLEVRVILSGSAAGSRAFAKQYTLQVPVTLEEDHSLAGLFKVRTSPFGLLYGGDGVLVRKGSLAQQEWIDALTADGNVGRAEASELGDALKGGANENIDAPTKTL